LTSAGDTVRSGLSTAAVGAVTALDVVAARRRRQAQGEGEAVHARSVITVNEPPAAVYARWKDFERLPEFMEHVESVQTTGGGRSHWVVASGPAGTTVEWDAEITHDIAGQQIAWRSLPGSDVENAGRVRFTAAPRGEGTEVRVELDYEPPAGAVGALVAKLFGEEPNQQLADDLRRFKQIVETGEVARSEGSPYGTRTRNLMHQEDAHPMKRQEVSA
jgi:uncharacterized membrane protein